MSQSAASNPWYTPSQYENHDWHYCADCANSAQVTGRWFVVPPTYTGLFRCEQCCLEFDPGEGEWESICDTCGGRGCPDCDDELDAGLVELVEACDAVCVELGAAWVAAEQWAPQDVAEGLHLTWDMNRELALQLYWGLAER